MEVSNITQVEDSNRLVTDSIPQAGCTHTEDGRAIGCDRRGYCGTEMETKLEALLLR